MSSRAHLSRLWAEHPYFDAETRAEIAATADPVELEDRFYKDLEFGTGGLRGVIAAGTNRMNRYTVRQATQGVASYILRRHPGAASRGVVIAYDSRRYSYEFALETALVLNANGISVHLWDSLRPTPMLSFAVRELGAIAGIVITASHNPPQYNGYKVYWEDGGQAAPDLASQIQDEIRKAADITRIQPMDEAEARERKLLRDVPSWVDRRYQDRLLGLLTLDPSLRSACSILYTPLHGTGSIPMRQALSEAGFRFAMVAAQEQPDPEFPTVKYPNPEEPEVFELALRQAAREQPDVILATDPDADRLGVMARDSEGGYRLLTGNQLGALVVDYLLTRRSDLGTLPVNGAVAKTIATSNLAVPLCREYGVAVVDTHTGFKFIGDKIQEWEQTGQHTFLFGFEESYGYLAADFVRDKDGVMAALLVAEATAYHKSRGLTLYDALERIWAQFGYFAEDLYNVNLPGQDGQAAIQRMMRSLRQAPPTEFGGVSIRFTDDYSTGRGVDHVTGETYPLALGAANVLHYRFADGGFVMVRPSGTEPKLKIYFSTTGSSLAEARDRLECMKADALRRLGLGAQGVWPVSKHDPLHGPYPLLCEPIFKERVWGGRGLERFFGRHLPAGSVGEAWVLGHHPHGTNTVVNGPLAGTDLGTACQKWGEAMLGIRAPGSRAGAGRFPLLVKLLDARDRLSVQVHPEDVDPTLAPGEFGKTEMWYVLDAEPGATIIYGLREGVGPHEFEQAIATGRVGDCLQEVPVQAGDAFLIPAGTIHALGSGVLVAEIQQSSDTTYRVYDYDRPGLDGRPRELHVQEALQVTRYHRLGPPRQAATAQPNHWSELARGPHFVVEKGLCRGEWVEETSRETFQAVLVISGRGRLEWGRGLEQDSGPDWGNKPEWGDEPQRGDGVVPLAPGSAVLLPATLGTYALHGEMEVLRAWLPGAG